MKIRIRLTYILLLAIVLPLLTACSGDDMSNDPTQQNKDGKITVHLRVSQASPSVTMRAWKDAENAESDEMMNLWTVVAVDASDKVVAIYSCMPSTGDQQEIDDLVDLPHGGTYRFYSFANIGATKLGELLNLSGLIPTPTTKDEIVKTETGLDGKTLTEETANAITVQINGNGFNPSDADNGLGSTGIPMSNVQKFENLTENDNVRLIVVRMLAKIELRLYNDMGSESNVKITSVELDRVTENKENNLKLLPNIAKDEDRNNMGEVNHGGIQPNLADNATQKEFKLEKEATVSGATNSYKSGNYIKYFFYVNESIEPNNDFKHFLLTIKLENGEKKDEVRYTLIDDKGATSKDDGKWNYIARNDYRIIPIVLDDYKLDMIPYEFPPIGVYPSNEKGIYLIKFHDFGHFHLQPVVTKYSKPDEYVTFTSTTPSTPYQETKWGLVNDQFSASWGSWKDATKAAVYNNESDDAPLYRKGSTANTDDGIGGAPAWAWNDDPTWEPHNGENGPYIFGFLEDPKPANGVMSDDKKVYHEFTINLYKEGMDVPRTMIYRLYMILDKDQMKYPQP